MRKTTIFSLLLTALFSFGLYSCASDTKKEKPEEGVTININDDSGIHLNVKDKDGKDVKIDLNSDDIEKGINQLLGDGKDVKLTDFREMKALLPSSIAGLDRTSIEGQKSGIGNLKASTAEAVYEDGDAKIKVSIVDAGGLGMMMSTMAGWAKVEVDNESDHGYERTTTIDGYKAFESYDSNDKSGSKAIIVEDRILFTIDGENVTEKQLKEALNAIRIPRLKRLIPS